MNTDLRVALSELSDRVDTVLETPDLDVCLEEDLRRISATIRTKLRSYWDGERSGRSELQP